MAKDIGNLVIKSDRLLKNAEHRFDKKKKNVSSGIIESAIQYQLFTVLIISLKSRSVRPPNKFLYEI